MYRPNFCAECGAKIVRLKWHAWTSGRFCDSCARDLRKERFKYRAVAVLALFFAGLMLGRMGRPAPPPLVIERSANSPLLEPENQKTQKASVSKTEPTLLEEPVYICGARTKKGTPCSRRVHGQGRCWQHKGAPSMLPQDKLLVKD
jgi:hypothetical protein